LGLRAGLVLFERNLRWFLQLFVGRHKETGRPYSLVNCLDTRFEGAFTTWPTNDVMERQARLPAHVVCVVSCRGVACD
jgi:hypothetical protein